MTDVNVPGFNRRLALGRRNAERELGPLERAYLAMIRRAGRDASSELRALTAAADWQPPPEGLLLASAAFAVAVERLGKIHRRVLTLVADPPLARVGIAFDVSQPLAAALLEQAATRTGAQLGAAVQPVLREAVAEAYEQGLSVSDAAALIRERIYAAAPAQAAMLARTDLNSLANGGSVAAATMAGMPFKRWLTAHDERVRETHRNADGQTVPVDQPFQVGDELAMYPGDPVLSDEEAINCRCTVIYADSADASLEAITGGTMPKHTNPRPHAVLAAVTITINETEDTAAAVVPWEGEIAFEDTATADGRFILPGALDWRELPLTLGAMTDTPHADLVTEARAAGRITMIERAGDVIRAAGEFDAGEYGQEIARMVRDETLRGVSIDLAINDWVFRDPETGELLEPDEMDEADQERAFFGELQMAVRDGTIIAATVCPAPAFANARISVTASGQRILRVVAALHIGRRPLTASAAGLAPEVPPSEWFFTPEPRQATPLTVTDDGHVFGHVAAWESCHTGKQGVCFTPPRSPSGYAFFNTGELKCADGKRVPVGQITFETDHASLSATATGAKAHYEHTGVAAADVRAVDGKHGIWVAGALRPSLSVGQARALMVAKPSGDWRQMTPGGPLEMIGVLAVNVPGFPVPRQVVASAEDVDDGETVAMVAAFDLPDDPAIERRLSVVAARADGIEGLADLVGA